MIAIYLQGRLGNQLSQYALGLSLSQKLNTSFFMDETYQHLIINKYFELSTYSLIKSKIRRFLFGKNKPLVEIENTQSYNSNSKLLRNDHCFYKGYFQSEFYFRDIYSQLKKEFQIKKKYQIDVRKLLGITNNKPLLVVHVRRTDYLIFGNESMGGKDLSLPLNYYNSCLASIKNLENYNIIFVTDDPDFVELNFAHLNPNISSNKNPIVDFQILLNADVLVVANSSFSWWGGYLNTKCKKVFAPKYWLGFMIKKEYPCDVIPDSWEKIEIV